MRPVWQEGPHREGLLRCQQGRARRANARPRGRASGAYREQQNRHLDGVRTDQEGRKNIRSGSQVGGDQGHTATNKQHQGRGDIQQFESKIPLKTSLGSLSVSRGMQPRHSI